MIVRRRSYLDLFMVLLCVTMLGVGGLVLAIIIWPDTDPPPAPVPAPAPTPSPVPAPVKPAPPTPVKPAPVLPAPAPTNPIPEYISQPISAPVSTSLTDQESYEAYKRIENWFNLYAKNNEAQLYLADLMDWTEGNWETTYSSDVYYVNVQTIRTSTPNTYYYKPYWVDMMWVLSLDGHLSANHNAKRIQADLWDISSGRAVEPNRNRS